MGVYVALPIEEATEYVSKLRRAAVKKREIYSNIHGVEYEEFNLKMPFQMYAGGLALRVWSLKDEMVKKNRAVANRLIKTGNLRRWKNIRKIRENIVRRKIKRLEKWAEGDGLSPESRAEIQRELEMKRKALEEIRRQRGIYVPNIKLYERPPISQKAYFSRVIAEMATMMEKDLREDSYDTLMFFIHLITEWIHDNKDFLIALDRRRRENEEAPVLSMFSYATDEGNFLKMTAGSPRRIFLPIAIRELCEEEAHHYQKWFKITEWDIMRLAVTLAIILQVDRKIAAVLCCFQFILLPKEKAASVMLATLDMIWVDNIIKIL